MAETTMTSDAAPSAYPMIELVGVFDGLDGRGLAVVDVVYVGDRVSLVLVSIVCDVGGTSAIDSVPTVVDVVLFIRLVDTDGIEEVFPTALLVSANALKLSFYAETELCT